MRAVVAVLLLLSSFAVRAQTPPTCLQPIADPVPRNAVRWSWTNPTTNTDASVIKQPITVTFYENGVKVCQFPTTNKLTSAASWNALSTGPHTWNVTASTIDGESTAVAVMKTVVPAPPNPITNLQVDPSSLLAYGSQETEEKMTTYPVALVAANTTCDATMSVNGLYHVPKSAVTQWLGNVRPRALYAACSAG